MSVLRCPGSHGPWLRSRKASAFLLRAKRPGRLSPQVSEGHLLQDGPFSSPPRVLCTCSSNAVPVLPGLRHLCLWKLPRSPRSPGAVAGQSRAGVWGRPTQPAFSSWFDLHLRQSSGTLVNTKPLGVLVRNVRWFKQAPDRAAARGVLRNAGLERKQCPMQERPQASQPSTLSNP